MEQLNNKLTNYKFFPIKNFWGKLHKEKGVYFYKDGTVEFRKCDGRYNKTVKFNIDDLISVNYVARFKFMFLIVMYSWEIVNSIAFLGSKGPRIDYKIINVNKIKVEDL